MEHHTAATETGTTTVGSREKELAGQALALFLAALVTAPAVGVPVGLDDNNVLLGIGLGLASGLVVVGVVAVLLRIRPVRKAIIAAMTAALNPLVEGLANVASGLFSRFG